MRNLKVIKDPSQIANNISSNLNIPIFDKQALLETTDLKKRLEKIHSIIEKETECNICGKENSWKSKKSNGENSKRVLLK